MKIMASITLRPGVDRAATQPFIVAEEEHVWADFVAGRLREMYFQDDPVVVTLIFEAAARAEVEGWLAAYPMVAAGLFDIELRELGPWWPLKALFRPEFAH
jgi:hypothetical protein